MTQYYLGIDLGGTFVKTAVLTDGAEILGRTSRETGASSGRDNVLNSMTEAAREAVSGAGLKMADIKAVGLGTPGIVLHATGVVVTAPNLPGWENLPLRDEMSRRLGRPVVIENDANAAAWGEFWVGAGKGLNSMAMLTLGTGIGGGIIINGEVLHGAHDVAAELGHMTIDMNGPRCGCGNYGCLEAFAAAPATVRRFVEGIKGGQKSPLSQRVARGEAITTKDIYEDAVAGCEYSRKTIHDTGRYLGVGISIIMLSIDAEMVVLTGGLAKAGQMLLDGVWQEYTKRTYEYLAKRTKIVFAKLANDAGVIGAAGCALKTHATSR